MASGKAIMKEWCDDVHYCVVRLEKN